MTKALPVTERQQDVLDAIRVLSAGGQPPTLEEIGAHLGMRSTWAVRRHLDILARKGFVHPRRHRIPRDIRLIDEGGDALAA